MSNSSGQGAIQVERVNRQLDRDTLGQGKGLTWKYQLEKSSAYG